MPISTAPRTTLPRRSNALGVHSLDRFAFSVPDLAEAARFYEAFGLDVRRDGQRIELRTAGNPHCWGVVHADGQPKRLQYLSFSAYDDDFERLARRIGDRRCEPPALADGEGIWIRDPDGTPVGSLQTGGLRPTFYLPKAKGQERDAVAIAALSLFFGKDPGRN